MKIQNKSVLTVDDDDEVTALDIRKASEKNATLKDRVITCLKFTSLGQYRTPLYY